MNIPRTHFGKFDRWRSKPEGVPKSWVGRKFLSSRSLENWMLTIEQAPQFRIKTLPEILDRWVGKHIVDKEQAQHLKAMFLSPDKENWVIAISVMKSISKKKKKR